MCVWATLSMANCNNTNISAICFLCQSIYVYAFQSPSIYIENCKFTSKLWQSEQWNLYWDTYIHTHAEKKTVEETGISMFISWWTWVLNVECKKKTKHRQIIRTHTHTHYLRMWIRMVAAAMRNFVSYRCDTINICSVYCHHCYHCRRCCFFPPSFLYSVRRFSYHGYWYESHVLYARHTANTTNYCAISVFVCMRVM